MISMLRIVCLLLLRRGRMVWRLGFNGVGMLLVDSGLVEDSGD